MQGRRVHAIICDEFAEQHPTLHEEPKEPEPMKLKPFKRKRRRIGRNEPCGCGSGMKFKRCCLPKFQTKERSRFQLIAAMAKQIMGAKDGGE